LPRYRVNVESGRQKVSLRNFDVRIKGGGGGVGLLFFGFISSGIMGWEPATQGEEETQFPDLSIMSEGRIENPLADPLLQNRLKSASSRDTNEKVATAAKCQRDEESTRENAPCHNGGKAKGDREPGALNES